MNNSPAPATKPSGQKLTLSVALLAVIGLAVLGMVSAGKPPSVVPQETPVTQKQDTLAEARALLAAGRDDEAAAAFVRVINDPSSTSEQLREAYEGNERLNWGPDVLKKSLHRYQQAASLIDKHKQPLLWAENQESIAFLLCQTDQYSLAKPLFREIVRLRTEHQGALHPDLLPALEWLSEYAAEAGGVEADVSLYKQIFEIHEALLGPDNPDLIPYLDLLGTRLRFKYRVAEALPYLRRSLAMTEAKATPDPKEVSEHLDYLAIVLKEAGQTEDAEPYARRYFEICEKELGATHPSLAGELIKFGEILKINNRASEAESMFQRAYAIQKTNSPGDEGYTPHDDSRLGEIFHEEGRLAEAEELYRKAIAKPSNPYFIDDEAKANNLIHLSQILEETDRLSEAEPLLRESAGIYLASNSGEEDLGEDVLSATANYLRAARELQVPEEEIHARMETEREKAKLDKAKFDKLWQEVLAKNPKDAVNALPTPPK